jgi:hypothetical protein
MKRVLVNTDNQRESTQETRNFYRVVRPSNNCLLPRCGVPMDEGCTQPLFMWSDDQLEYHDFSFLSLSHVCEESPQLGASRPYNDDHERCTEVREGRATHTRLKSTAQSRTQVTTRAQNTTHWVHNSNGAQVTITKNRMREVGVLES